jgi:cell division protein ZapA
LSEPARSEPVRVAIRILDKDYHIACSPEEKAELLRSAELLNERMREIRDTGKVTGADRIAVMAALNLAHELLRLRDLGGNPETGTRLKSMRERIETALHQRTTP